MATYLKTIRQGLPRMPGGDPWPAVEVREIVSATPERLETPIIASVQTAPVARVSNRTLRQGLPRVSGGAAWPAQESVDVAVSRHLTHESVFTLQLPHASMPSGEVAAPPAQRVSESLGALPQRFIAGDVLLRQGLPRLVGGKPWPGAGFAPLQRGPGQVIPAPSSSPIGNPVLSPEPADEPKPAVSAHMAAPTATPRPVRTPQQGITSVAAAKPKVTREPVLIREKPLAYWIKLAVLGVVGAITAAGILVLAARGVTTLPGVPEWLERYPGVYELPEAAKPGFPWWARWSHFLNIFLMVLIIRSGLLVRHQQKPPAFWTPKRGGKKISINLWLHTCLDVVWLLNGAVFIVLLFVSGHWMRIVPTSWEVIPNALSALLQYFTLDWPPEHGWVNYNSLQQIMYFLIVFVAAPLAAITGVRMSEWWPKNAEKLNKFYPAPLARVLHFPTMLFFVMFILVHVFLVFSTGALRNLNHMFAGSDAVNWVGFWLFALAIFVTAAGWGAARPLLLAAVAGRFGKVSNR